MKSLKTKLFTASLLIALASCSGSQNEDEEEEKKDEAPPIPKSQIIGRVTSVSPHSEFVLIQKYGAGRLPSRGIYLALGPDGRTASIRPSGERVRDFHAADILNGEVKTGDTVIVRQIPSTEKPIISEEELVEEEQEPASSS